MELTNRTPFPSKLLTGSTGEQEIVAMVASKVTFLLERGRLVAVTGEEAWPVFDKPHAFGDVMLDAETEFRKSGVDLLVFGRAHAPRGQSVTWTRVVVRCGSVKHEAVVFGERVWVREGSRFVPSAPAPFTEMPITNDRAYGGEARLQGSSVVQHAVNPDGRGLVYLEEDVEGTPLPNLEHPDRLIGRWQDQPRPLCFFKPKGLLLPEGSPTEPAEAVALAVMETSFNQTVPELVAPDEDALGDTLELSGLSPDGDVVFPMPPLRGPVAHVRVGDLRSRFPSRLTTVVAMAAEGVLVASYLAAFRYLVRPEELRSTELVWPDAPPVAATAGES
ncbi:MAG: DUF2169 domain-containing protein [Gemmatimonadota bacterium]|jgi:hypothetical protein